MKEIGGYFELESLSNNPYYRNMIELNSGRNALLYLIQIKQIKKIYLPYYLCKSVSLALKKNNYEFEYYHTDEQFSPLFYKSLNKNEYLYIVNHFGVFDNNILQNLKNKYHNIIVDNTHSFFQKPLTETDTLYSLRKFFGVPDGAYLKTDSKTKLRLSEGKVKDRISHLVGRYEENASAYYTEFKENDAKLGDLPIEKMSRFSKNIMRAIDYDKVMEKRVENFQFLKSNFENSNIIKIRTSEGPFCYPLLVEDGNEVRKKLASKKIYIPTLWPNVIKENAIDTIEYNYAKNILPLPCDQRYSVEDMKRIVEEIYKCIN